MSIWWLLWFVLSFVLLGTTIWSYIILFQQKKAWSSFAKKKGLVFNKGDFFGPCEMEGTIDGFNISFFTATQQKEDSRKNRQLTVMQIILPRQFIDAFAAGTNEMLPFLHSLGALSPHSVDDKTWDEKAHHMFSRNKEAVDAFLTTERLSIINNMLKMANSDNLIVLSQEEGLFRFETSNPLTEEPKIEKLVSKLILHITKLQPDAKELAEYKRITKANENKNSEENTSNDEDAV